MADPFLAVGVEGVGDGLFGRDAANVFALELADELQRVEGDAVEGAHDGAIFHGPVGADEG